jgi:hypothetical protein
VYAGVTGDVEEAMEKFYASTQSSVEILLVVKTKKLRFISRSQNDLMRWVQTALPTAGLEGYSSKSQRARIATEAWGLRTFTARIASLRVSMLPRSILRRLITTAPAVMQASNSSRNRESSRAELWTLPML